jgi:hypothetical protein
LGVKFHSTGESMLRCIPGIVFLVAATAIAVAQSRDLLPNTIDCSAFTKLPDGSWQGKGLQPST